MMEISWYLLKDHILQHYSMHILKYYGIKSANQPTNQSINQSHKLKKYQTILASI